MKTIRIAGNSVEITNKKFSDIIEALLFAIVVGRSQEVENLFDLIWFENPEVADALSDIFKNAN